MADGVIISILPNSNGAIIEQCCKPVRSPSKHAGNAWILMSNLQTAWKGIGKGNWYSRCNSVLVKKNDWQTQHVMIEVVISPFVDYVCRTCCQYLGQTVVAGPTFTFHPRVGYRSIHVWSPRQRTRDAWVSTPDLCKSCDARGKYWGPLWPQVQKFMRTGNDTKSEISQSSISDWFIYHCYKYWIILCTRIHSLPQDRGCNATDSYVGGIKLLVIYIWHFISFQSKLHFHRTKKKFQCTTENVLQSANS
jgi:hypothetical protein